MELNSISPRQVYTTIEKDTQVTILPETFYIFGSGFNSNLKICKIKTAQGNFEVEGIYVRENLVACVLDFPITFSDRANGPEQLEIQLENAPASLSVKVLPAVDGTHRSMTSDDYAMYMFGPRSNIINGVLSFKGAFPKAEAQNILYNIITDEKLKNFRSRPVIAPGEQAFWYDLGEKYQESHLEQFRELSFDPKLDGKSQLTSTLSKLIRIPLSLSRPMWEMWLIDSYKEGDETKSIIVFRSHHLNADGIGLVMALFKSAGIDIDQVDFPGKNLRKQKKKKADPFIIQALKHPIGMSLHILSYALLAFHELYRALANPVEPTWSPLKLKGHIEDVDISWLDTPFKLKEFKKTAKDVGISFNDLVLSLISGSLRKIMINHHGTKISKDYLDKALGQIHASISVSIRSPKDLTSEGDIVGNKAAMATLPMFVQNDDTVNRSRLISDYSQRYYYGAGLVVMNLVNSILTNAPRFMLEAGNPLQGGESDLIQKMVKTTSAVLSSVPGPVSEISFGKSEKYPVESLRFFVDPDFGISVPLLITAFSYNDELSIATTVAKEIGVDAKTVLRYMKETYVELQNSTFEKKND